MNIPHTNLDFVLKDALTLFKNKTLEFFGLDGISPIGDSLRTETVEIEITWEFQDLAFATLDGGGIHFEMEADLSHDDMLRFGGYNISLSRTHKREFVTVVFVKNPTEIAELKTKQMQFSPIIIQCSKIDGDKVLDKLRKSIATGQPINELEAIYLPMFHSKVLTPTDLFMESAGLIKKMQAEDGLRQKILTLLVTLSGKVVDRAKILELAEEIRSMGNVIFEVFEERGWKRGTEAKEEEIAKKMLAKNMDVLDIIEITGLSTERLREIRKGITNDAMLT